MEIRFYVFWCGWFRVFVVEIRITIITATFVPAVPAPPPAPPVTTTSQVTACESEWSEFEGKCYKYFDDSPITWDAARQICQGEQVKIKD